MEHFTKDKTPQEAVVETAERICGSFSVMAYSKQNDKLYYFKERSTNFFFGLVNRKDGKVLLGSTTEEWLENAYLEYDMIFPINSYKEKIIVEATEEIVYQIDGDGIREVDKFTEDTSSGWYNDYTSNRYGIEDWEEKYPKIEEFLEQTEDDLKTCYGLNSRQRDYKKGTMWVRCNDDNTANRVKDTYYFAKRTKKGLLMSFGDLWEFVSNCYGMKEQLEREREENFERASLERLKREGYLTDTNEGYIDPYQFDELY